MALLVSCLLVSRVWVGRGGGVRTPVGRGQPCGARGSPLPGPKSMGSALPKGELSGCLPTRDGGGLSGASGWVRRELSRPPRAERDREGSVGSENVRVASTFLHASGRGGRGGLRECPTDPCKRSRGARAARNPRTLSCAAFIVLSYQDRAAKNEVLKPYHCRSRLQRPRQPRGSRARQRHAVLLRLLARCLGDSGCESPPVHAPGLAGAGRGSSFAPLPKNGLPAPHLQQ